MERVVRGVDAIDAAEHQVREESTGGTCIDHLRRDDVAQAGAVAANSLEELKGDLSAQGLVLRRGRVRGRLRVRGAAEETEGCQRQDDGADSHPASGRLERLRLSGSTRDATTTTTTDTIARATTP